MRALKETSKEVSICIPELEAKVIKIVDTEQVVRISLTQENKGGKIGASFVFTSKGVFLDDFIVDTATRIFKILELQEKIRANGGCNNVFGFTKSGMFELNMQTMFEGGEGKILNNFTFTLGKLGTLNPAENLVHLVQGFKLLTD